MTRKATACVQFLAVLGAIAGTVGCSCDPGNASSFGNPDPSQKGQQGDSCTSNFSCKSGVCDPNTGTCQGSCIDNDDDDYGVGCFLGTDCDDNNPDQNNLERCGDNVDNDCDTEVDETETLACGCSSECDSIAHGRDGIPFDPENKGSTDIGLDDEGSLQLISDARPREKLIWIANTREGSISKVNVETFEELGRFQTGPNDGIESFLNGNDPSRTTADPTNGDIYVTNRAHGSVIKISSAGSLCGPNTSTPADLTKRLWSGDSPTDDCIVWNTNLREGRGSGENRVRAAALQIATGLDGVINKYVWIGGFNTRTIWKLNADTGQILLITESPVRPYGFALDRAGNLWISSRSSNDEPLALGRVDTNVSHTDTAAWEQDVCDTDLEGADTSGDTCTKQRITPFEGEFYGVTVDKSQRVWLGGGTLRRYDLTQPLASRVTELVDDNIPTVRGVAADSKGFIYGATTYTTGRASRRFEPPVFQVDGTAENWNDGTHHQVITATDGYGGWGIAVDAIDQVWVIPYGHQNFENHPYATVLKSTDTLGVFDSAYYQGNPNHPVNPDPDGNGIVLEALDFLFGTYTYSDMTGQQLAFAVNPLGTYNEVFEGCPPGSSTVWASLLFDVETPAGTTVAFRGRTAPTIDGLTTAEWFTIGGVTQNESSLVLESILAMEGISPQRYLEIEVQLSTGIPEATPKVHYFEVSHVCQVRLE